MLKIRHVLSILMPIFRLAECTQRTGDRKLTWGFWLHLEEIAELLMCLENAKNGLSQHIIREL